MSPRCGTALLALALATSSAMMAGCSSPPDLAAASAPAQPAATPVVDPAPVSFAVPSEADSEAGNARRHWRNGDLAEALRQYRQVASTGQVAAGTLLELGEVEAANGDPASARMTLGRLLESNPGEPVRARARIAMATAELAAGDWQAAWQHLDLQEAPDGLTDLVTLRRAQAALLGGNLATARVELARPELLKSTNRLILEQAGNAAERAGVSAGAAELYARGSTYFGWTAERSRMVEAAASAFERAGNPDAAVGEYRTLVASYTWTKAAQDAGAALVRLGELTAYEHGLLALSGGRRDEARDAFRVAMATGRDAALASAQLRALDEREAWMAAVDEATAGAYRAYLGRYPTGTYAAEARFREGFAYYESGRTEAALATWDSAAKAAGRNGRSSGQAAAAEESARLLFWTGKGLSRLGRDDDARASLEAASKVRPANYYAVRARDLLARVAGWPGTAVHDLASPSSEERAEAERWIASWSKEADPPGLDQQGRLRRGLGLLALGLTAEAAAEMNQLIAESRDAAFLFRVAQTLFGQQLWTPVSRAAAKVVGLSPAQSVADAPVALQRLVYPPAYWDLVAPQAAQRGLDPLLLLAVIHQESRYDPLALSIADARGLTQVLPSTGRGIAAALGSKGFTPEDLYRPPVAVQLGSWYLANQLATLGGDPFRALAAYNAGSGPITRWAAADPDLFVERIDYSETRSYVRQIYLHYGILRSLTRS